VKARVLLVDADAQARAGLAQRLGRIRDIDLVGAAGDVDEASRLLDGNHVDLVLVDLHQQNGSEIALCQGLRPLIEGPLVALASFMTPERWEPLERAGVNDCLLKRVDTGRLGRELLQVRERFVSRG
jgi:DNA-binding NarL/FixJ family response regulator